MPESREYRFHIDAFTPDTLPMARLSEYLEALADLLGDKEHVHFLRVEEAASTNLAYKIDLPAVPAATSRIELVKNRSANAPPEAIDAFEKINAKLAEDGATARIESDTNNVIIFPGRNTVPQEPAQTFGPIIEPGTIDGQIVRVGGFDKTIPVHMRSGPVHHYCNADESMARRLGPYILGKPVRVFGEGKWYRDENEQWIRKIFTITNFEELEDVTLTDSIARLRSIPGTFHDITDPLDLLNTIRRGPGNGGPTE